MLAGEGSAGTWGTHPCPEHLQVRQAERMISPAAWSPYPWAENAHFSGEQAGSQG